MNKRIASVLAVLITVASLVACEAVTSDPVVKGHKEIAENVGDWGSKFADGWSRDEKSEPAECEWSEFGPCDQGPPLEWFGITDDNGNGINDADE
jgi:hypothetical protein